MKKMKRIVALVLGLGFALSSVACGSAKPNPSSSGYPTVWTPETVYAKAQELGFEGTWEEFREMMKGVDGVGISSVSVNANGELVIRLSNNQLINCGKVRGEACAHSYQAGESLAPTCESIGYESQVCTLCGDTKYAFKPATGHEWELLAYWADADSEIYGCKVCHRTKYEKGNSGNQGGDEDTGDNENPGGTVEQKTQLYIALQDMGYGSAWLQEMATAFEEYYAETSFEAGAKGVQVVIDRNKNQIVSNIVQTSTADLYLVYNASVNYDDLYLSGCLEEITDAATTPWGDEQKTVLEKLPLDKVYMQGGRAYAMPYAEMQYGITYNASLFDKLELEVPNTTDELVTLCQELMQYGVVPFTSSGRYSQLFWDNLPEIWWAQYEGVDAYARYWQGEDENGQFTLENFSQTGRLKALQAFESISNSRYHARDSFSSAYTHIDAMQDFFMSQYKSSGEQIAMMPYLDCLYFEAEYILDQMEKIDPTRKTTVRMMKTPVLSSIIEKCPTIPNDQTLSAVIEAIDNGLDSYTGVSNEDFNRVAQARGVVSNQDGVSAFVKKGSANATLAKEFLRFMTSDQAIAIAAEKGMKTVLNYEYAQAQVDAFDPVTQSVLEMRKAKNTVYLPFKQHNILYRAGLQSWINYNSVAELWRGNTTAQTLYNETISYYTPLFEDMYQSVKGA